MILAFSGWRGWTDAPFIHKTIDQLWARHMFDGPREVPLHVRVGDAEGVDAIVRSFVAGMDAATLTMYVADWTAHGKAGGAVRNKRILIGDDSWDPTAGQLADLLVAFPEPGRISYGKGSGTWNCIGQAHYRGIEVRIPAYRVADEMRAAEDPLFDLAGQVKS